ncbi:hypothetical protein [Streptomyces mirabilis]|uniref:hypothetical protein n=1 Tax=Streptomyces mirabilis TaxID=68239 RepID=UPI00369A8F22
MPRRRDYSRRTISKFKKKYGPWVYLFSHEVTEIPGYATGITTVRRKKKGDSRLIVGELVHCFTWEREDTPEPVQEEPREYFYCGATIDPPEGETYTCKKRVAHRGVPCSPDLDED